MAARRHDGLVVRELRALSRSQREGLVAVSVHITSVQVEPVAETVIDLDEEIIAVDVIGKAKSIIGLGARQILLRVETEELRSQRILRPAGGGVSGPGGRNVRRAGHGDCQRRAGPSPLAFETYKEEGAIVADRTAGRAAVVAVLERTFLRARQRLEEISCVQLVVAQKLIESSMDIV